MLKRTDRLARIVNGRDLSDMDGFEVGPRDSPLILKQESRVRYVDFTSTEELKAAQFSSDVQTDKIVEIDIVTRGAALNSFDLPSVDYIVASHVIEHIPNLIGWLNELHAVLRPRGILGLAIPDQRFIFDLPRPPSGFGEMVEAYLFDYRRPSVRQVFESAAFSIDVDVGRIWDGWTMDGPAEDQVEKKIAQVFSWAKQLVSNSDYIDAHCWVFTPQSFLKSVKRMSYLGLFPFTIEKFHPTAVGSQEFHVTLEAISNPMSPEIMRSIVVAEEEVAQSMSETIYRQRHGLN